MEKSKKIKKWSQKNVYVETLYNTLCVCVCVCVWIIFVSG